MSRRRPTKAERERVVSLDLLADWRGYVEPLPASKGEHDWRYFGTITIDGKTYEHDVVVRLSGEVVKRKKKLSKKLYGTSHVLSEDEARFLFERGCDQVVIGSGQFGNVRLSPEAEAYFERKGCEVLLKPTPEAIQMFNRSRARRIGLFHVTC